MEEPSFDPTCRFCAVVHGIEPAHIVYADETTTAFLDRRPLFPGHTLVVPNAHVAVLADLPDSIVFPFIRVVRATSAAMEATLGADGSFVAMNNRVSQSVPHIHFHVVPRHRGDGLRGFFWPRQTYESDQQAAKVAEILRRALAGPGRPEPPT